MKKTQHVTAHLTHERSRMCGEIKIGALSFPTHFRSHILSKINVLKDEILFICFASFNRAQWQSCLFINF